MTSQLKVDYHLTEKIEMYKCLIKTQKTFDIINKEKMHIVATMSGTLLLTNENGNSNGG